MADVVKLSAEQVAALVTPATEVAEMQAQVEGLEQKIKATKETIKGFWTAFGLDKHGSNVELVEGLEVRVQVEEPRASLSVALDRFKAEHPEMAAELDKLVDRTRYMSVTENGKTKWMKKPSIRKVVVTRD